MITEMTTSDIPTSRLAITAFTLGVVAVLLAPIGVGAVVGLVALAFGYYADNDARSGTVSGHGLAVTGMALGAVGLGAGLLLGYLGIPGIVFGR